MVPPKTADSLDPMRELLGTFINALLSAQADSVCGAEYGTRSEDRTNRRNGYRHRDQPRRRHQIRIDEAHRRRCAGVTELHPRDALPGWC